MKKLAVLLALCVLLVSCGPNVDISAKQTEAAVLRADNATLVAALNSIATEIVEPTDAPTVTPTTEPTNTPTVEPTEESCAYTEYVSRMAYGFFTGDDELQYGKKQSEVSFVYEGCVLGAFVFEDGSRVDMQLSEDGKEVVSCSFYSAKKDRSYACTLSFNNDPEFDENLGMDGRILRDLNDTTKAEICLAVDVKEYTTHCRTIFP